MSTVKQTVLGENKPDFHRSTTNRKLNPSACMCYIFCCYDNLDGQHLLLSSSRWKIAHRNFDHSFLSMRLGCVRSLFLVCGLVVESLHIVLDALSSSTITTYHNLSDSWFRYRVHLVAVKHVDWHGEPSYTLPAIFSRIWQESVLCLSETAPHLL